MSEQFACGYVLTFRDGGEPEEQVLYIGTLEECEELSSNIPGVCYSGRRPVDEARFVIVAAPTPALDTKEER